MSPRSSATPSPLITLTRPIPVRARPLEWAQGVTIQPYAGEAEAEAWLEIQNEILRERGAPRDWGPLTFQRELAGRPEWRPDCLLMAYVDESPQAVGCVSVQLTPRRPSAHLRWLAVRVAARRRGVASRLVEAAEQRARTAGYRELRAETLRAWQQAIHFYQALGFAESPS